MEWEEPEAILRRIRTFAKPYDGSLAYTDTARLIVWDARVLATRKTLKPPGSYHIIKTSVEDIIEIETCQNTIQIDNFEVIEGTLKSTGRFHSGPPVSMEKL